MDSEITGENTEEAWKTHCRTAARKFLMNAVVIDNLPEVRTKREDTKNTSSKIASKAHDGMEELATEEEGEKINHPEKDKAPSPEKEKHRVEENQKLDIREISDAFAREQIACAFVLPDDNDPNEDLIFKRIADAALPSDIIVIDWYLRNTDPTLTQKILTHIAEKDSTENGRLRVICVYTGQPNTSEVTRLAAQALEKGGLGAEKILPEKGIASSKNHCLLVLNKQSVVIKKLPNAIIEAFAELSEGLLPSFVLAAVAAVRRNMHHIITRFSKNLDAAYVANRLITNPPSDVAELIRQLFISECDTALGLEKVADNYLEPEAIKLWLKYHNQPRDDSCEYKKSMKVDGAFLYALLENGITDDDKEVILEGNQTDNLLRRRGR